MRLTKAEQIKLLSALPSSRVNSVRRVCEQCGHKGSGIKETLAKARSALGPIASEIGPVVLKQFIMPMLLKKLGVSGEGCRIKKVSKSKTICQRSRKVKTV